jgi:hypothetical protein
MKNRWRSVGRLKLAIVSGIAAIAIGAYAETVGQCQSLATAIDTTEGGVSGRVVAKATVVCSAAAVLGDDADMTGVTTKLYCVEPAGVPGATTSQVASATGSEVSSYIWNIGEAGPRSATFVLQAYRNGVEEGDALSKDVSFGIMSAAAEADAWDSRTNSLQLAFDAGQSLPLAYDTAWADGAASARLSVASTAIYGNPVATVTNVISTMSGNGTYSYRSRAGNCDYTLICELLDAEGAVIDTQLASYVSRVPKGLKIILK